jgi:hypothetical protein
MFCESRDKLEIAARLRWETTLSIKAIAARVRLGTSAAANAKQHLHLQRPEAESPGQTRMGI